LILSLSLSLFLFFKTLKGISFLKINSYGFFNGEGERQRDLKLQNGKKRE